MNKHEALGQAALKGIERYTEPQSIWIGADAKRLYELEQKRSDLLKALAEEMGKLMQVDAKNRENFWYRLLPQVLHDTLESFEPGAGIVAAEAYLKRHGWKVERPALID